MSSEVQSAILVIGVGTSEGSVSFCSAIRPHGMIQMSLVNAQGLDVATIACFGVFWIELLSMRRMGLAKTSS